MGIILQRIIDSLMTGTSARNHHGIFKNNKAKYLASKYGLDLNNPDAYIHLGKFVTYSDVSFMVENFWLDHFIHNTAKPLDVSYNDYNELFYSLQHKYPTLLTSSFA